MYNLLSELSLCLFFVSFQAMAQQGATFDIQGHRGARGLFPENTIPAFLCALDERVSTLEMDVVISADSQVVVSHEHWMNPQICTDSLGKPIAARESKKYNIYRLTYEEIQRFDCGSKKYKAFPEQTLVASPKPLLVDVIQAVEEYSQKKGRNPVGYNIEIKTIAQGAGVFHPELEVFSDIVYALLSQYLTWDRVTVQSFDFDVLRYWHTRYPQVRLSALVETPGEPSYYLQKLGFLPHTYSPHHQLLTQQDITYLHARGLRVVPWTVNKPSDMIALKRMGVDGLITDYPNRASCLKDLSTNP